MSLQKQIDLIMTTILKNTDKIYEENPDDNYRANCTNRLSYIRVVRMFTTTVDFKDFCARNTFPLYIAQMHALHGKA